MLCSDYQYEKLVERHEYGPSPLGPGSLLDREAGSLRTHLKAIHLDLYKRLCCLHWSSLHQATV